MKRTSKVVNRYFTCVIYPEDENYDTYFKNILDNFKEVTWCTHDRDLDEEGNTKKRHTHILFKVRRKRKIYKPCCRNHRNIA